MCRPHQIIQAFRRRSLHIRHYHFIFQLILQVAMVVMELMLRKHKAKKEALSFV